MFSKLQGTHNLVGRQSGKHIIIPWCDILSSSEEGGVEMDQKNSESAFEKQGRLCVSEGVGASRAET